MAAIGLLILGLALLVSILFNLLQLKWRNEERAARAEDNAEQKRKDDHADANRVNRGLLQSPPEKKHRRGPEGREERNQPDVVEK